MMGIPAKIPLGVSKRAYLTLSGVAKSLKNERLERRLF
jgi:hydrogenase small subunit